MASADAVIYSYDSLSRVAERNGTGFAYTGLWIDPTSDGVNTYGRSPAGRVVAHDDGTVASLVGLDRHGDVTWLADPATGGLSDSKVYDPFGDVAAATGASQITVGFQGDYTDPASGEVWMGARWYDPTGAQFRSRDTIFGELSTPVSLNRYSYGFANPLVFWDPDGRFPRLGPLIDGEFASPEAAKAQAEVNKKGKEIRRVREARRIYDEASSKPRKSSDELENAARISKVRARYEQELAGRRLTVAADPPQDPERDDDKSLFESAMGGIGSFFSGAGDVLADVGESIADAGETVIDVGATIVEVGARCVVDFINSCSTNVALFISPLVIGGLTLQAAWAWGASCATVVGCVAGTLIFGTATGAGIYGTYRQAQEVWFGPNRDEIYQELAPSSGS